jgi:hypothetical protein
MLGVDVIKQFRVAGYSLLQNLLEFATPTL